MRYRLVMLIVTVAFGFAASARAEVAYPSGTQDFEALTVGQPLTTALPGWPFVNMPANSPFTVTVANDVNGVVTPRGTSTKWLRSNDMDGTAVQNRFYSPGIVTQNENCYRWTWYVNLETLPPGGTDTKPKLTIQHRDTQPVPAYANAWGIEFTATGANLIVLGIGGTTASVPLSGTISVKQWAQLELSVNFKTNFVSASIGPGPESSLPINLNGNKADFRFCYRGEGAGNVQRLLVDDVSVIVGEFCPALSIPGMAAMLALIASAGGVVAFRRNSGKRR